MKIKLYTKSHPTELLKKYCNNNEIFTSKEHSKIIEESSGEIFKSKSKLLKDIKSYGIKEIVDFNVGCMNYKDPIIHVLKNLKNFVIPNKDNFKGKFHGYLRNKGHIKKLIKKAGWSISSEIKNDRYYITILN